MKKLAQLLSLLLLLIMPGYLTVPAGAKSDPAPGAKDKCPVCGMFVSKYPDWTAVAKTRDGTNFYYDGPKDMFSHYFDTGRYTPDKKQSDFTGHLVREYYSLKLIAAKTAFFVIGSDVYGPMGSELIPFAAHKDAAAFMKDHNGKRILSYTEITAPLIKSLK